MKHGFKKILYFLIIPIVLGGVIHYSISYKVKNILQYIVAKESDNTYAFKALQIEISFWNKSFLVKDAQLISLDSAAAKTHYSIKIPKMYLSIHSWGDVLFNQKVSVDSLRFVDSRISIYEKSRAKTKVKTDIRLADVFSTIEDILGVLEIKSFSIHNGAFSYRNIHSEKILSGEGINFSIQNFSRENKDGRLLYADDIRIDIKDQKWYLPDGIHTVSFKSLNFSGKNQFFELDSFSVFAAASEGKSDVTLFTEKFFFNSLDFSSMYKKNALYIDTLLCIRPVLTIGLEKSKLKSSDSSQTLAKFLPGLFKETHFNYINVEDGQFTFKNKADDSPNALVQKSNLKIYNLSVKENRKPYIETDSILFGLKDIKFVTPDSTYQIVASELMMINNDLVLRNTLFGPTRTDRSGKNITFSAPEFRLNNINFIDLLQKRLNANMAELYTPHIRIIADRTNSNAQTSAPVSIDRFYSSLHGFRELVGLEKLKIRNGDIFIQHTDSKHTVVHMKGIDAMILPIHFVNSDSLIDIKKSLPELDVAEVSILSGDIQVNIKQFAFDGINRKSHAAHVHLFVKDHIDIEGEKIYWEIFDWDLFQKYRRIQIRDFEAETLSLKMNHSASKKPHPHSTKKMLPDLRVDTLKVGRLHVYSITKKDTFSIDGKSIEIDSLRSSERFFSWKRVSGTFQNISFKQPHVSAHIQSIAFKSHAETHIQYVLFDQKQKGSTMHVEIPSIKIAGDIYSTDLSELGIHKIRVEDPTVNYRSKYIQADQTQTKKEFAMPFNFQAKDVHIVRAAIQTEIEQQHDTLISSAIVSASLKNITTSKTNNTFIEYDQLAIEMKKLNVLTHTLSLNVPDVRIESMQASAGSSKNQHIRFDSDLKIKWTDAAIDKDLAKDNAAVHAKGLSGTFYQKQFSFASDKALAWQSVLKQLTIESGSLNYHNSKTKIAVGNLRWENKNRTLHLHSISLQPRLSRDAAFKQAGKQFDYLQLYGKSIELKGIDIADVSEKPMIHIRKIELNQLELSSSRDKNFPKKINKAKEMPTKLIQSIPWPTSIDSIQVNNSNVLVHQIEARSDVETTIPIQHINALILNVTNKTAADDSLYLLASAKLLDVEISRFKYTESYSDSLSYFHASTHIIPGKFQDLNPITVPLAHIYVDNGYSNKLDAHWAGNKYAAIGEMNFIYKDLAFHLLSKGDTSQTNLGLFLENKLANNLIKKDNKKTSVLFFERNKHKQIFNYWLKATLQGVYTAVGVKSNKRYLKHYRQLKEKNHLPAIQ